MKRGRAVVCVHVCVVCEVCVCGVCGMCVCVHLPTPTTWGGGGIYEVYTLYIEGYE